MRFTLQNLGRLREATIDLSKDLILLTGQNNTSKTYVAHTIYGFCGDIVDALFDILTPLIDYTDPAKSHIDVDLAPGIRDRQDVILRQLEEHCRGRLADILAADETFTAKTKLAVQPSEAPAGIAERFKALVESDRYDPSFFQDAFRVSLDKPRGSGTVKVSWLPVPSKKDDEGPRDLRIIATALAEACFIEFFFPTTSEPFILTAERSAIQLFSHELSLKRSGLVDSMLARRKRGSAGDPLRILERNARRYSLPIRDGLRTADDLAVLKKNTSTYAPLADRLERDIMQGAIRVSEDGDMLFHPDHAEGGLRMHLASSSVKALSGLSFYLRHLAQKGQFLIIDEPELNLHPDNQRRVARLLGRLARSGVKVMISTHSDYVIREINNLIMLSADKSGEIRGRHGYEEEETLSPSQVGAYLFDAETARPIEVETTGIEVKSIDEEINKLNTTSQDIYFSLFEKSSA